MAHPNRTQRIRFLFRVGILLKGIDGFMELIGGLVLLSLAREFLSRTVALVTAHELSEDPHDLLANALTHTVSLLSADTRRFAGAYLIGHGCIKIVLVAGLWREKRWAYPVALWFLGAFVAYQPLPVRAHAFARAARVYRTGCVHPVGDLARLPAAPRSHRMNAST
jgi:uncharacterized membrane protein